MTASAPTGALLTPTVEGANVIAAAFDINDRSVERHIQVCVEVLASAPSRSDIDQWDTVEEVDVDVNGPLEVTDGFGTRFESLSREIGANGGLSRIRVAARARSGDRPRVQIAIWRTQTRTQLTQLRHVDGVDLSNFGSRAAPVEPETTTETDIDVQNPATSELSPTPPVPLHAAWREVADTLSGVAGPLEGLLPEVSTDPASSPVDAQAELAGWFDLMNRLDGETRQILLPGLVLLTSTESERVRDLSVRSWNLASGDVLGRPQSTAAVPVHRFVTRFVPIAERDGSVLVVDTREGEHHGCVVLFDKTEADSAGPRFQSIGALLHDLSASIDTAGPFLGAIPRITGGRLTWEWV